MESLRLKKGEAALLHKKNIEINKILINNNRKPVTESELLHAIIEIGLERAEAGEEQQVSII